MLFVLDDPDCLSIIFLNKLDKNAP